MISKSKRAIFEATQSQSAELSTPSESYALSPSPILSLPASVLDKFRISWSGDEGNKMRIDLEKTLVSHP